VARGAGLTNCEWARDETHFVQLLDCRFDDGGPMLVGVKIDGKPGLIQTPREPSLICHRVMNGLGTGRSGPLDA
jgi:hypothetical protein